MIYRPVKVTDQHMVDADEYAKQFIPDGNSLDPVNVKRGHICEQIFHELYPHMEWVDGKEFDFKDHRRIDVKTISSGWYVNQYEKATGNKYPFEVRASQIGHVCNIYFMCNYNTYTNYVEMIGAILKSDFENNMHLCKKGEPLYINPKYKRSYDSYVIWHDQLKKHLFQL